MWQAAVIALSLGQIAPVPSTAAESMRQAHADLQRQPPAVRPFLRYLSLHNLTEPERAAAIPVLAGHCNQLSRVAILTRPARVGDLLRVNLRDYGWSPDVWEKLSDPYYLTIVEKINEHGRGYWDGPRWVWTERYEQRIKATATAPWLVEEPADAERIKDLVTWTGSRLPVTRADWFFNQTAIQADRDAGYYDWLGIKDEAGFQKAIGFDRKLSEGFRFELREAVALSGVTLQPRAITRHDSLGGAYWRSLDFKLARGETNPLKVLGRGLEKSYDATEVFGHLPNGMWATGLFDRAGKRQDFAPPEIASDGVSRSHDRRVHVNVSCIRCHGDGGLQPIDGWVRNLLNPPLELRTTDYEKAVELRQQYLRTLEPFLARDKATYEAAVKEATGLTSKAYATAYAAWWERYEDAKVTTAQAAHELGTTEAELRRKLLAWIKAGHYLSPAASSFVHEGARARALPIRQYEEIVSELHSILRGVK